MGLIDQMDTNYDLKNEQISREKFLKQLPDTVIDQNGEIVNVKKGLEEQFLKDSLKGRFLNEELSKTLRS